MLTAFKQETTTINTNTMAPGNKNIVFDIVDDINVDGFEIVDDILIKKNAAALPSNIFRF